MDFEYLGGIARVIKEYLNDEDYKKKTTEVQQSALEQAVKLFSEARRAIDQGGSFVKEYDIVVNTLHVMYPKKCQTGMS